MNIRTEKTSLASIDDKVICDFLDWLEISRGNSVSTRNLRLAAIHAFYRYVQMQHPEILLQCQRIIAIPLKETEKKTVEYLPEGTLKELLSLPNQSEKYGIRDTAILCLLYITLTVQSFSDIIADRMDELEQGHFDQLMDSRGNRQYVFSPFSFDWTPYISCYYGCL